MNPKNNYNERDLLPIIKIHETHDKYAKYLKCSCFVCLITDGLDKKLIIYKIIGAKSRLDF